MNTRRSRLLGGVCAGVCASVWSIAGHAQPPSKATVNVEGRLAGHVGVHAREFATQALVRELRYAVDGQPDYVAVTEVYADQTESATYRYTVTADGLGTYTRCRTGRGFGAVTYWLRVARHPVGEIVLRSQPGPGVAMAQISTVCGISSEALRDRLAADCFHVMGMVHAHDPERREKQSLQLISGLRERPELGVMRGLSAEIYYACRSRENVRGQLRFWGETARQHRLPLLLGMVSWWAGTPLRVPDGLGGHFGDIVYQQICYAPDLRFPEREELRALLGERYTPHYTLTTPNQWSNTPWLTLNSAHLNRYRQQRLDEAAALLEEVSEDGRDWLQAIFLENEPRYWDHQIDPNHRRLWADFNPHAVAAARADGIVLDPADGLSDEERLWLHRNGSRYNQETVDAMAAALDRRVSGGRVPLYTHALMHPRFAFPARSLNHPPSDWAYARGAHAGLEGILTQPSDLERVREWGRWSNLNREEGHGKWMHADLSLWDLRGAYLMGADLYNSYNWSDALFAYVDTFLANLPVARLPPAAATLEDAREIRLSTPMALQAFTRIELPVEVSSAFLGTLTLAVSRLPEHPPGTINLARAARVSASSTDSEFGYCTTRVNDGDSDTACGPGGSWTNSRRGGPLPQWVVLDFGEARTFNTVTVFTSEGYPLRDFQLQVRRGDVWRDAGGRVTDNTSLRRMVVFDRTKAEALRVLCHSGPAHQPMFARINEIVAYDAGAVSTPTVEETWYSMPQRVNLKPGTAHLAFDFPTPAESRHDQVAQARLLSEPAPDAAGGVVRLTERSAAELMLNLDLRTQRSLSLWVIDRAESARPE